MQTENARSGLEASLASEAEFKDLPILSPANAHIHADLDIIDKCNPFCPTCFRGAGGQKNTSSVMPIAKFEEVARKLSIKGYCNAALINWTEPFLCKTLDQYIKVVKHNNLDCRLSSNLSLPPREYAELMTGALASGVNILFVSVSGFHQETYQINHSSGRVNWVKENLAILAKARRARRFKTSIWLRFLEWPYNAQEGPLWRQLCQTLNVGFEAIPAHGAPKTPLPNANAFRHEVDYRLAYPGTKTKFNPLFPKPDKPEPRRLRYYTGGRSQLARGRCRRGLLNATTGGSQGFFLVTTGLSSPVRCLGCVTPRG